jgi:hypothetical protein
MKDPSAIMHTSFGFWESKVVLTAVEFDLFTVLGASAMTGGELEEKLSLHPRGTRDFLDSLVSMGFLNREGNGPGGLYRNTESTSLYMDKTSSSYIGGILVMLNERLYKHWDNLGEGLRTGKPQNEVKQSGKPVFEELYDDLPRLEQFMGAMAGISRMNFEALARKFDFSRYKTLCDVGGATGLLSVIAAREHPNLTCISFDLPAVEPIAKKTIENAGLSGRVSTATGDFFCDPLPRADVLTMGMILHDWGLEKKKLLIGSAYEALPENGALIAIENLIDDERRVNTFGLLMSLNMLIETGEGFDYTGADFKEWCGEAGFRKFEIIQLAGTASAAVAYK